MNLNNEQFQLVRKYCSKLGKNYYDVEIELVDHMVTYIENRMETNADFGSVFETLKLSFSTKDIEAIILEKKKAIAQRVKTQCWNEFLTYFSLPKIGLTFLLFAFIIWVDQNKDLEKSARALIHLTNLLNIRYAFGRGMLANKNVKDKISPILSMKVIYNYHLLSVIPAVLYFILSLTTFGSMQIFSISIYKVALYLFPFIVLLSLAWQKIYIDAQLKIRKDYPNAFAS